ncbi:MAG: LytR C-terminal domain-containing protein [Ignavibacterium sp.]|uniref:LytR C-terminal domain-containing protein n=1 Tax=Ignavibacterium sp. TaxID=2651167 RepID=UPI00404A199C
MSKIDKKDSINSGNNQIQPQKFLAVINLLLVAVSLALLVLIILKVIPLFSEEEKPMLKSNHVIQVEVLNACGAAGLADKFTDLLRSKKFDVVKTGNFASFDIDNSFIIDRVGNKSFAYSLADSIGISKQNVIQQFNKNYYLDVTLVIGKDFNNYLNQ